jgi:hypothetical protein
MSCSSCCCRLRNANAFNLWGNNWSNTYLGGSNGGPDSTCCSSLYDVLPNGPGATWYLAGDAPLRQLPAARMQTTWSLP